jgi:hypothetical protein
MLALEPLIQATIASALALLFASAAIHKLRDWSRYRETLANYRLLPLTLAPAGAVMVVAAEIAVVVGCVLPATRSVAAAGGGGLLLLYAAAMSINLRRGRELVDCGCGGFGQRQPLEWWMVRRNLLLATLALLAALPVTMRNLGWSDLFIVTCASASAAGLYVAHAALFSHRHAGR